jgi:putative NADPH-quinone reductase
MTQSRSKRITIIDGHPDPDSDRYCHALAGAYASGAAESAHAVKRITIAELEVPVLRSQCDWEHGTPSNALAGAQQDIAWATHLVIIYPLWLGTMPALLKAFLEQVFRPGFAIEPDPGKMWAKLLTGRSARVVVTMGMPAWIYRWYFFAHSLKSLERNILAFVGIGPIKETLIGGIGAMDQEGRKRYLENMRALGREGK